MKIAALADEPLKDEILSKNISSGIEWIWVGKVEALANEKNVTAYFDLQFRNDSERINSLATLLPKPVIVNSVSFTLESINQPFIRMNAWPGFVSRPLSEIVVWGNESRMVASRLFDQMEWPFRLVPDLPGMVSPRIISMIINEAYYTYGAGVSSKEDIDRAMKLGTNYPFGPFEWAEMIGLERIHELLSVLSVTNKRYTISDALIKEVRESQFNN
jgi:3-hydroxybutyryl-CoA dehydrogenase